MSTSPVESEYFDQNFVARIYLHENRILLQELDGLKEIPPTLVIDGRTKKKGRCCCTSTFIH